MSSAYPLVPDYMKEEVQIPEDWTTAPYIIKSDKVGRHCSAMHKHDVLFLLEGMLERDIPRISGELDPDGDYAMKTCVVAGEPVGKLIRRLFYAFRATDYSSETSPELRPKHTNPFRYINKQFSLPSGSPFQLAQTPRALWSKLCNQWPAIVLPDPLVPTDIYADALCGDGFYADVMRRAYRDLRELNNRLYDSGVSRYNPVTEESYGGYYGEASTTLSYTEMREYLATPPQDHPVPFESTGEGTSVVKVPGSTDDYHDDEITIECSGTDQYGDPVSYSETRELRTTFYLNCGYSAHFKSLEGSEEYQTPAYIDYYFLFDADTAHVLLPGTLECRDADNNRIKETWYWVIELDKKQGKGKGACDKPGYASKWRLTPTPFSKSGIDAFIRSRGGVTKSNFGVPSSNRALAVDFKVDYSEPVLFTTRTHDIEVPSDWNWSPSSQSS